MSFYLKRNLLFIAFIIATISILWLLIQGISYTFNLFQNEDYKPLPAAELKLQQTTYVEKIDNFALQEFDHNRQISHFIEAKHYFNFKDSPALLLNPKVITYDDTGRENYTLRAQRANYFNNGNIKFSGEVDVHSNAGIVHKINTAELLVSVETDDLIARQQVTYLDEGATITAQGMHLKSQENKMTLNGKVTILQNNGSKILTTTLYIDESNGKKHYYSKNNTTYLSVGNKIYAQAMDMNLREQLLELSGKVKILQNSGGKINTRDLIIDRSKNGEIYRTKEKTQYQSNIADIRANGMYYDGKNQKIELTNGVLGRYE